MRLTLPGIMSEKSCLPVQRGLGLMIAGWGIFPSHDGSHISRFIIAVYTHAQRERANIIV